MAKTEDDVIDLIVNLYLSGLSQRKVASTLKISVDTVQKYLFQRGIPGRGKKKTGADHHMSKYSLTEEEKQKVRELADGIRTIPEIAEIVNRKTSTVEKYIRKYQLPTNPKGRALREKNHSWKGGRNVSLDGYIYVRAPKNHPYARYKSSSCEHGMMLEHRLVMENILNRYLLPEEVVHHKDRNTLNNHPDNLEVHGSNAEHLKTELTGKRPDWSEKGIENFQKSCWAKGVKTSDRFVAERIDTYGQSKASGALRKQRILLAHELLGKDHPCLLGTERFLDNTQTDDRSKNDTESE